MSHPAPAWQDRREAGQTNPPMGNVKGILQGFTPRYPGLLPLPKPGPRCGRVPLSGLQRDVMESGRDPKDESKHSFFSTGADDPCLGGVLLSGFLAEHLAVEQPPHTLCKLSHLQIKFPSR